MPLGTDHVQAAQLGNAVAQLDVGSAAGHVGGDRHAAFLAGLRHDLGLDLVVLGVQDLVFDPLCLEQGAEPLRLFDGPRADEYRHALLVPLDDLESDRLEPFFRIGKDAVRLPDPAAGPVGRHLEDADLVNSPQFGGVRRGGAGHSGQLVVSLEEVLNGHASRGDRFQGDLQPLLGLDGLVQPVLPLASRASYGR